MGLKLYMVPASSPVRTVLITAKALGLNLERIRVNLAEREQFKEEYLKINPQHTVPTLDDDGKIIWDSHAICIYLITKYGKDDSLYPNDPYKRAIINQRLHFDTGVLFAAALRIIGPLLRDESNSVPKEQSDAILEAYAFLEKFLDGQQWAAGDTVTLADLGLITSISTVSCLFVPLDETKFPNIAAWRKRVEALPCYQENIEGLNMFKTFFSTKLQS